jgi:hypothetical protein
MIIYRGLIELDYNPATDVVVTTMPNVTEISLSEVEQCFQIIVTYLRNYDIKKMLLDASKSIVEVEDAAYQSVVLKFGKDLMTTRLQKLARVGTVDKVREEKSQYASTTARQQLNLPIAFANFSTFSEAMDWLLLPEKTT